MPAKRIAILGSTGSVGRNALQVVQALGPGYRAVALGAQRSWEPLREQVLAHAPLRVALQDTAAARSLKASLNGDAKNLEILDGPDSLAGLIRPGETDLVLLAVVGAAGLALAHRALSLGIPVALANKECMVVAGGLLTALSKKTGAALLPVDSEHNAVFQLLQAGDRRDVERITLTGSGGPFRGWTTERMAKATVEEALKHPTWKMGPKITVDSATMMNKALEVIEARWLFELEPDRIEILVHPQSIVHGMVAFRDGALLAHLGHPDMKAPIQHAFTWPARSTQQVKTLDLAQVGTLTFERPDPQRFPALALGRRAAAAGGTEAAVLNAANEIAVEAFLAGRIPFPRIVGTVEDVLSAHAGGAMAAEPTLEDLLEADAWARRQASEVCRT